MKFLTFALSVCCLAGFAKADVLRLRNGTEFAGRYIGGTKTEIWFQRDGMVPTMEVIPTSLVEGLKFEPDGAGPAASVAPRPRPEQTRAEQTRPEQTWMGYLRTVLATAWFPYSSSTRTATVTSPAGRAGIVTR